MATSKQVEPEPSVERTLQQIAGIEVEGEGEGDPLEGLGNKQIAVNLLQALPRGQTVIQTIQVVS